VGRPVASGPSRINDAVLKAEECDMARSKRYVVATLIAIAVGLSACAGSSSPSKSSSSSPPAPSDTASPGSAEAGFQSIDGITYKKAAAATQKQVASNFHKSTGKNDPGYSDIDTEDLYQGSKKVGDIVSLAFQPPDLTTQDNFKQGVVKGFATTSNTTLAPKTIDGKQIYEAHLSNNGIYVTAVFKHAYVMFVYSPQSAIAEKAAAAQL
jgi:hypothetical protein